MSRLEQWMQGARGDTTMWTERGLDAAICLTCSTQFPHEDGVPDACPICSDDRQYVRDGEMTIGRVSTQRSRTITIAPSRAY